MADSSVSDIFYSGKTESITTSTAIKGRTADDLGMEDFFTLLVAQMSNQDMTDPQSNTEYVSQMAQFTSLQGMQTIQEYQLSNYAVSYTGKTVTLASINESTGKLEKIDGIVERVTFYDGNPQVWVNGTAYGLHQVMEVKSPDTIETVAGNSLSQVAGYIGKTVTVTDTSDPDFPISVKGEVTSVTLKGGKPYVILDYDKEYPASAITDVGGGYNVDYGTGTDTDTGTDNGTDTDIDTDDGTTAGTDDGIYDTDDDNYDSDNAGVE